MFIRELPKLLSVVVALQCAAHAFAAESNPPPRSLGRVFEKLKRGDETTIAYFGGSITAASGYRVKTFAWFTNSFPAAKITQIHAAIGGTGSDLGAFRCAGDVIATKPDLVFVEFNINDGSPTNEFRKATMEGIVRQLWASESKPEIVFLYTSSRDLNNARGSHPAVARHYGIPEIDLQPPLIEALKLADLPKPTEEQLKNPKLNWKAPGQVFMSDTVHPNDLGHTIYADTIIGYLKTQMSAKPSPLPKLGPPFVSEEFARVTLVKPTAAKLSGEWEVLPPDAKKGAINRYKEGAINAQHAGDALEFEFEGTALGLYLNVQTNGGRYEWTIDDGQDLPSDAKHGGPLGKKKGKGETAPQQYFPRYNYALLTCGLPPGKHTLKLRVLEENDKTSTGHRLLIGYFMVGGTR